MLNAGEILKERYQVEKMLGEGGMGTVYQALDLESGLQVAVKELHVADFIPEDENTLRHDETVAHRSFTLPRRKVVEQFQVEINLLKTLDHDQLPRLIDSFSINDQDYYYVMTLIEGQNLAEVVKENHGPLSEEVVRDWLGQILSILKYCHSLGVIHRDVKPENLLLGKDGRIYLIDFGIAREFDSQVSSTTTVGARAFTPYYSPPEQRPGGSGTDVRTDIYAVGAVLYFLITGLPPLDAQQLVEQKTLTRPARLNPLISPELENLILRCIRLEKAERPQTIADMEALLEVPLDAALLEGDRQFDQDRLLQSALKPPLPSLLPDVKAKPLKSDRFLTNEPVPAVPSPEVTAQPTEKPPAPPPLPEVRAQPIEKPPAPAPPSLPEVRAKPAVKPPSPPPPPLEVKAQPVVNPVAPPAAVQVPLPPAVQPVRPQAPSGGASVQPPRVQPLPARSVQPSSSKEVKNLRRWLMIGIVVLLVITGIILATGMTGTAKSPRAALRQVQANNDYYTVTETYALVVDIPDGLLANDRGVDMSMVSVGLSTSPQYGLLKLNADGSFTYVPERGFTGRDTFTYHFVAYKSPGDALYSDSYSVIIYVEPLFRLWLPAVVK